MAKPRTDEIREYDREYYKRNSEKLKARERERYHFLVSLHLCPKCKQDAGLDTKCCPDCIRRLAESRAEKKAGG